MKSEMEKKLVEKKLGIEMKHRMRGGYIIGTK
jgi:hypothetical protein